jgi:hypothetical protein
VSYQECAPSDNVHGWEKHEYEADRAEHERAIRRGEERRPAPLPTVHLPGPCPVIAPPTAPGATPHQQRSNLLGMCATADRYRAAGQAASLKRQLARIALREGELKTSSPEMWPLYERDREAERQARKCAAVSAEPARPAPEATPPPAPNPAPVATATRPGPQLAGLDMAVEQLVREYSSGAVIDAAWAAAHRLFSPNRGKAA